MNQILPIEDGATVVASTALTFDGDMKLMAPAFIKAQMAMGAVIKEASNEAFKRGNQPSKYADLAAVNDAAIPALNANGFGLMQPPHSDGVLVEIETILLHESGGLIRSTLSLRPTKADPQGIGSAITYGRRYALLGLAGLAPEDDDGNAASRPREQGREGPNLAVTAAQTAITMAGTRVDLKRWKAANEGMLADMAPADHNAVVRSYSERWNALAPPSAPPEETASFRDRSAGSVAQRNSDHQGAPLTDDDIPEQFR